jgi:hypothetical protein
MVGRRADTSYHSTLAVLRSLKPVWLAPAWYGDSARANEAVGRTMRPETRTHEAVRRILTRPNQYTKSRHFSAV